MEALNVLNGVVSRAPAARYQPTETDPPERKCLEGIKR